MIIHRKTPERKCFWCFLVSYFSFDKGLTIQFITEIKGDDRNGCLFYSL